MDDIAYFDALIDDIAERITIDRNRVFVTGLSNGGAMSFRLACELSAKVRGAAPIGGGLQFVTAEKCEPGTPVPMLYAHGTDDPCWQYQGGASKCPVGQDGKEHLSVQQSLEAWQGASHCDPQPLLTDAWKDGVSDDIQTRLHQYQGCDAEFTHLEMIGAGHTWPDGHLYLSDMVVGPVSRDWGNEVLLDFFDRHN